MEGLFDEEICDALRMYITDVRFILRHMQNNKGTPYQFKMASELEEAQVKIYQVEEDIYAFLAFMKTPSATLEGSSMDTEKLLNIQEMFNKMKLLLQTAQDSETTPDEKEVLIADFLKECEEMNHLVFESLPKNKVFEPNTGRFPYHSSWQMLF
jgi:hypothetical protein